jgi:hypothetical protein
MDYHYAGDAMVGLLVLLLFAAAVFFGMTWLIPR